MKIVSSVLENIEGIQIYYIIGLIIFISFFITVIIRTYFLTSNKEVEDIKNAIFDNDDSDNNLINTEKLN